MSLQRIDPTVLSQIHTTNSTITTLINIMQKRPLDRMESTQLAQAEAKMKWFAGHAEVEFAVFRQYLERIRMQNGIQGN